MWTPPVVDMEDPSAPAVLAQACRDFGFFYVENHGVSEEAMREVFRQSKAFFSLCIDDKMTVKEGYYIFREMDAIDTSDEGEGCTTRPLKGSNQWPSETLVPGWKATMQDHFTRMHDVGERLVRLLSEGLDLDSSVFRSCFSEFAHVLRLLHYSAEVSDPGEGVMGAGAHSDWGLMTLLATVRLDGEWLDVPPRKGAFICNLGDMLQRWTNDELRSTVHRVVNKLGRERYSIPFFFEPNFDTEVACFPQFCSEKNPAKYSPVTAGAYLMGKYAETHQVSDGSHRESDSK